METDIKMDISFKVERPVFREAQYDIRDYGAVAGGRVSNTEAINAAIRTCSEEGGGHVIVPSGLWLTGPVRILTGVDLHVENGAVLMFDKNREEYPLIISDYEGQPRIRTVSPIMAVDAQNVAITGEGTIDGNGELWRPLKKFKVTQKQWDRFVATSPDTVIPTNEGGMWFPTVTSYDGCMEGEPSLDDSDALKKAERHYDFYRPVMVNFVRCDRVLIDGVTLQNSPAWNVHPLLCTNLTVSNAFIKNPYYAQNGDGIDVESCQYVEIYNTKFEVGDDGICLKSGKNEIGRRIKTPTKYVYIHDCTVMHAHGGFVVGSEMSRGMSEVYVQNCAFIGTDVGIRFKSQLGRGGIVENINLENINMTGIVGEAIIFTMGYSLYKLEHEKKDEDVFVSTEDIPVFRNVNMKNITCVGAKTAFKAEGIAFPEGQGMPTVYGITLEDSEITADSGLTISNAQDIHMKNVTLHIAGEDIHIDNDENVR